jgi:cell fate regulator YaaT (PSP1 superfamily)
MDGQESIYSNRYFAEAAEEPAEPGKRPARCGGGAFAAEGGIELMPNVVGIRFKKAGKIYYFDPSVTELKSGDFCIVETSRGLEFGAVVTGPKAVAESDILQPLRQVVRRADEEDCQKILENRQKEEEAFNAALQKIEEHDLDMKLVDVEYTFDRSKIIFYFTSDGRVDFRELVKSLAAIFKTRIELRQIGVRDEAKMIGGLGPCGRVLCCHTFLGEFEPVSIRMAKDQNLSLNPAKISGACGRLMCCLRYESDTYESSQADGRERALLRSENGVEFSE